MLQLSYGIVETGWRRAIVIYVILVGGLGGVLGLLTWYTIGGGMDAERDSRLAYLVQADPRADAADAIRIGDLAFIAVTGDSPSYLPGVGGREEALRAMYPVTVVRLYHGFEHDRDAPTVNTRVIEYARTYNRLLLDHLEESGESLAPPPGG